MFQLFFLRNTIDLESFQVPTKVSEECLMMDIDTDLSSPELSILLYERRSLTSATRGLEKRINEDKIKINFEEAIVKKMTSKLINA